DSRSRNDIARERCPRRGIGSGLGVTHNLIHREEPGEISRAPSLRSDARRSGTRGALFCTLVMDEKERLVPPDGPAESPADNIPTECVAFRACAVREETVGVHLVVSQELECVSM